MAPTLKIWRKRKIGAGLMTKGTADARPDAVQRSHTRSYGGNAPKIALTRLAVATVAFSGDDLNP